MSEVTKWVRQLERLLESGTETSKILPAIDKILFVSPKHVYALHCKVVCLIHQDKHAAALAVLEQLYSISSVARHRPQELIFHEAYCHYRMFNDKQAQSILCSSTHTAEHVPSQHLLAQIHYRLEQYEEAAAIYQTLLRDNNFRDEQEKIELVTNYSAACAALDVQRTQSVVHSADVKNADLLYNAATAQLEVQDYTAALQTLQQAEVVCCRAHPLSRLRSFEDACTKSNEELTLMLGAAKSPERAFFNEVANIWVQMAFVYYSTKNEEKAMALLSVVLKFRPSSEVTTAVASINWAAIQRHKDFFDTYRKLKSAQNPAVNHRLTTRQRLLVQYNTAMLLLHTGSFTRFKRQVELVASEYPDSDLTHSLKLALVMREDKKRWLSDDKIVTEYLENYKKSVASQAQQQRKPAIGRLLPFIMAQIFMDNGDLEHAIESLVSAPDDIRWKPSTVATLVTWKVQLGDVAGTKQLFNEYVLTVSRSCPKAKAILIWVVRFLAGKGYYTDAVDIIRDTQNAVPDLKQDTEIQALLALCLSYYDMQAARMCMEMIPEAKLTGGSSSPKLSSAYIAELERQQPSRQQVESFGYLRRTEFGGHEEDFGNGVVKTKKRRPRPMRRPPKNDTRIDPERWIPMSMRSYIKDLPERRKRELKRLRKIEQERKRHQAARQKAIASVMPTEEAEGGLH
ncbi:putative TPR like repeat Tetratricopeptide repeat SRP72 RNA binding domain [Trypanosoma vivax]|uniref:Signal recognition particle subunit SRP72 n=1 Tax=Trypanosoma vivax (strain Y486) TaxID=1055687 RepID=G0U4T2_TRYVY|nr:putative signal recognition particle protein [Trypanosoma vivax]KAH8611334.1 putative TPR like repeat Tetratricopeptide repeat SRP72 RNA binding domain [Trypanosoma vivax]CCC52447.1 putative signal recognition particle protein [Trypanosoma vivax Y486]